MSLVDNILAYWKLDNDGSGGVSLVDSTGNSNTLTNNNGVTLGTGIIDSDAVFSSTNQYLENNGTAGISLNSTISFWFKGVDPSGGLNICGQWTDSWVVGSNGNGGLYFVSNETGIINFPYNNTFDGNWHFYVLRIDNGALTFYVDGSINDGPYTIGDRSSAQALTIGATNGYSNSVIGDVDEFGIWSRALSSQEITDLYNSGNGLTYPFVPVLYYNAGVNTNLGTLGNWWKDSGFSVPATSLPDSSTPVVITQNATAGTLVCSTATINNASVAGSITGVCKFNGTSTNSATITGNASVYYPSQNPLGGSVSGSITYYWPNGTGIWGGDVWVNGENVVIIPAENEVKAGVVYGFPNDPLTGTYTGSGGGGVSIDIARLIGLPSFIKL